MKKLIVALGVAGLLLTGCSSDIPRSKQAITEKPKQEQVETRPGNPDVYKRIESTKDCDQLQKDFDLAEKNGQVARDNGKTDLAQANTEYMKAALKRQEELKCFG